MIYTVLYYSLKKSKSLILQPCVLRFVLNMCFCILYVMKSSLMDDMFLHIEYTT